MSFLAPQEVKKMRGRLNLDGDRHIGFDEFMEQMDQGLSLEAQEYLETREREVDVSVIGNAKFVV